MSVRVAAYEGHMARPLRPQVENGVYHVFNRGNAREPIFRDDADRAQFIATFKRVKRLCGWSCLAYCLLVNHYHLVVRTPRPDLSRGMARLDSGYAQAFNRRHDRVGHLFQGRFGSRLVQEDDHLLTTLRYVALNPVESSLCSAPENWRWSGHSEILGLASARVVDVAEILKLIADDAGAALRAYRALFGDDRPAPMPSGVADVVLGEAEFVAAAVSTAPLSREIPKRQRLAARPDLSEVFRGCDRDNALLTAYFDHGYAQREIAEHLGCHYSTVSRWLRSAEERTAMWQRKT